MRPLSEMPFAICRRVETIFTDIDDTLTTEGRIPAVAFDAVWRAHDAGLRVVLVPGRPAPVLSLQRLRPYQEESKRLPKSLEPVARPIHVLLVDDSRVTREMVRRLLEDAGFEVTGVDSAENALRVLGGGSFDCLVTDIEMPDVDGLELTRRLREVPEHADLPIVVVSTLDRPADRLAGLESGADAYLTKQGLDVRELVALIRRVGGGR